MRARLLVINYNKFLGFVLSLAFILFASIFFQPFRTAAQSNNEALVCNFQRDLKIGMIGDDVRNLQRYLNQAGFILAQSGPGSPGRETNVFGNLTQVALIKFQNNKLTNILDKQKFNKELGNLFFDTRNFINNNFYQDPSYEQSTGQYYSIGGNITGLVAEVILKNNNVDIISVKPGDDSNFVFPKKLTQGASYSITVESKHPQQLCYWLNNNGTISNSNITNIAISCGLNLHENPFVYKPIGSRTITYTLNYSATANGSISGSVSQVVSRGSNGQAVTAVADSNYHFVDWSDSLVDNPRTDLNVLGDISVSANFAINTYTITFDKNTGDTEANPTTRTTNYNTTVTLPVAPTKVGHTFHSWNTQADGNGSTFDASTAVTADATVYAKWTALTCGDYSVVLDSITYGTVAAADGECWLDRNLGAGRVANAAGDSEAYGYLYQWGRSSDGHQLTNSGTTADLSASDTLGHGNFITTSLAPHDWRNPQNDNLWQGLSGTNNVCPTGFRIPTRAEWTAVLAAENITSIATAYSSALKLTLNGYRDRSNGISYDQSAAGNYWSSSVSGTDSLLLFYDISGVAAPSSAGSRAYGLGVRCIKD